MGIWDWYNRPGGHKRLSTRTAAIVMIVGSVLCVVVMWLIYSLIFPFIFRPLPPLPVAPR